MKHGTSAFRNVATTLPAFAVWFASVACMLACLSGCVGIKASACSFDKPATAKKTVAPAPNPAKQCSTSACCHESTEASETAEPNAEANDLATLLSSPACLVEHHDSCEDCPLGGKESRFLTSQNVSPESHAVIFQIAFFLLPAQAPTPTPRPVATYLPCRSGTHLRHCVFRI